MLNLGGAVTWRLTIAVLYKWSFKQMKKMTKKVPRNGRIHSHYSAHLIPWLYYFWVRDLEKTVAAVLVLFSILKIWVNEFNLKILISFFNNDAARVYSIMSIRRCNLYLSVSGAKSLFVLEVSNIFISLDTPDKICTK
jgi:hypothetical protein